LCRRGCPGLNVLGYGILIGGAAWYAWDRWA
jgi:hypothetical protein